MGDFFIANVQIDSEPMAEVMKALQFYHDAIEVYYKAVAVLGDDLASTSFTGIVGPAIVQQATKTAADLKKVMELCAVTGVNLKKAKQMIESADSSNAGLFK